MPMCLAFENRVTNGYREGSNSGGPKRGGPKRGTEWLGGRFLIYTFSTDFTFFSYRNVFPS